MRFIRTSAILLLSALSFNCFLNSGRYEYVRFSTGSIEYYLDAKTNNYLDETGYYSMHAEDSSGRWSVDIVLPEEPFGGIIYIPGDNYTEIRMRDNEVSKSYSASSNMGIAEVKIESLPDSVFKELSGSFSGLLVDVENSSDTLKIESGYFIFVF